MIIEKKLKCIIVGVDYSRCGENALKEARRIAAWHGARLICLHVCEQEIIEDFQPHHEMDHREILSRAQSHLTAHVDGMFGPGNAESKVVIGYPFQEILREVEKNEADLLVLGSRGHQQKDSRRTGVLAARCVRTAPVEVLLVRQRQEGAFRSVVACVDFSATAKLAASRAVDFALQDGASLEFLHVFATPMMTEGSPMGPAFMSPLESGPMFAACESKLKAWVEELLGDGRPPIEVRATVKEGISAGNVLVEHLREKEVDLAVLGTRGRTGLRRLLLGTTAERLIHDAPCSTLAVKPEGFHYELD